MSDGLREALRLQRELFSCVVAFNRLMEALNIRDEDLTRFGSLPTVHLAPQDSEAQLALNRLHRAMKRAQALMDGDSQSE